MISGRRSAPGRLGALYDNRLPGAQVAIGSYELSGTVDAPGPAEQTVIGVVQVQAPAGPYTVWADRSGGAAFEEVPAKNRLLYVLNDLQIATAEKMVGEPPAYLAVLTDRPGNTDQITAAFNDTRYQWMKSEALYSQADQARVPTISFLHWAELRPTSDWKGRSETAQGAATRLGGTLVFPIDSPVSPSDRGAPQSTFDAAFDAQFPNGGQNLSQVVASPESGSASIAAQQQGAKNALMVLVVIALGAGAGYAGYKAMRGLRRQTA